MEDVREVLHLYLGQQVQITINIEGNPVIEKLDAKLLHEETEDPIGIKPILRRLDSMTEEEDQVEFPKHNRGGFIDMHWYPEGYLWLLSKGFWLFGDEAFDKGLIIDSKTLNKEV